ncbi:MAG TPA: hypothetical protein VFQ76_05935 [Longimicrobiaceae bacterium]|nr:hypothetical protein [Longimicrobiaceae bacterium]
MTDTTTALEWVLNAFAVLTGIGGLVALYVIWSVAREVYARKEDRNDD